jgi:hypothetical protein
MPKAKSYIRYRPGTILQCMTSYLGVLHVIACSCFYSEGQIKLKPKYCTYTVNELRESEGPTVYKLAVGVELRRC